MTREEIKKIVYDCVRERFYNPKEDFDQLIMKSSYDGEDLLLYSEIGLDSLDMIEFLMRTEECFRQYKIIIPDEKIDSNITLRKIIDYIYGKLQ